MPLFARAVRWKAYWGAFVRPFLGLRVLEVGAGIGGTTAALCDARRKRWVCLEQDPAFVQQIESRIGSGTLPACCSTWAGTIRQLPREPSFDTILYVDVLEHIADDRAELREAAARLESGGRLIVLSPAMNWLMSPFDRAIGHYRRYSRRSLRDLRPGGLKKVRLISLDVAGVAASLANRLILRQSCPTPAQIAFWDRRLVPLSRVLDPLVGYRFGKSILGVWEKE